MPLISHTPSFLVLAGELGATINAADPQRLHDDAMYQHIIDWSRFIYRETREDAILLWIR
jgi:hypothetical protein